jgi:hypothetical protein
VNEKMTASGKAKVAKGRSMIPLRRERKTTIAVERERGIHIHSAVA